MRNAVVSGSFRLKNDAFWILFTRFGLFESTLKLQKELEMNIEEGFRLAVAWTSNGLELPGGDGRLSVSAER